MMSLTNELQSLIDKKIAIEMQIRNKSEEISSALTEKLKYKEFYYGVGSREVDTPNVMVNHVSVEFTISSFVFIVHVHKKLASGDWSTRLYPVYYSELSEVPIKKIDVKL